MDLGPRTKFWVTDPPAVYEDDEQGVCFMLVFTTRRLLMDHYQSLDGGKELGRRTPIQKRWARLVGYVKALRLHGINIDPDPNGVKPSTLVIFNSETAKTWTDNTETDTETALAAPPEGISAEEWAESQVGAEAITDDVDARILADLGATLRQQADAPREPEGVAWDMMPTRVPYATMGFAELNEPAPVPSGRIDPHEDVEQG